MRKFALAILFFIPLLVSAQSLTREAVTSGGGHMENAGYELSCSYGQLATATLVPGLGGILSQGFQQVNYDCPGDLNFDGQVNTEDLLLFLGFFGCEGTCLGDFNHDGLVNTQDLLFFLGYFGTFCS
jgi:hypothetical protein